ncbi:ABC transporter ATP-binding protein [Deinococcus sp. AJ005]|uniref:ABC transporter ATP-binding protein n=1 Tax=Deinococcus sp. AJ005 TaxID=2652443 RepID=UPI00125CCB82|nr:ABC transporter ATP-binding protein [Deinococcus sp. AJ005]QFP76501.1 ABC transporter ATP-binding protein [Deinococcus sp. AJ005]
MNAIETTGLSKLYAPGVGLAPLNLSVPAGEIFGFIGPNGAGKTTAIRTLMGFLRPSGGSAHILGHDVWQERVAVHRRVGYLPGEVHLARDHTARELMGRSCRLRGGASNTYGLDVARRLELRLDARLGTLSKGNRQKVGLTLALMHRPELLMLDEPTDGLDPLVQETVLDLLREAGSEGRSVFLSSHVLSEIERIAGRVGIIRRGELIRVEGVRELKASLPQQVDVGFALPPRVDLMTLDGMSGAVADGLDFRGQWRGSPDKLIRALAGESLTSFSLTPSTLEDAFMDEYRSETPRKEEAHVA